MPAIYDRPHAGVHSATGGRYVPGTSYTLTVYRSSGQDRLRCPANPFAHSQYVGTQPLWADVARLHGPSGSDAALDAARERLNGRHDLVTMYVAGFEVVALVDEPQRGAP